MKSFKEVHNGHTYRVTCSEEFLSVILELYEDDFAVTRKRVPSSPSFKSVWSGDTDMDVDISFEGVTAIVTLDCSGLTTVAKSCAWSFTADD